MRKEKIRYEDFVQELKERTEKELGEKLEIRKVSKPSGSYLGIGYLLENDLVKCGPTYDTHPLFAKYLTGKASIPQIACELAGEIRAVQESIHKRMWELEKIIALVDCYEDVRPYLKPELTGNIEELGEIPFQLLADGLAVVPTIFLEHIGDCFQKIVIPKDMLKSWNITEKQLFLDLLSEEQEAADPPVVEAIGNIAFVKEMEEMMGGAFPESFFSAIRTLSKKEAGAAISSVSKVCGAGVIAYPSVQRQLAEIFPKGYYIIPMSIHELLAFPENGSPQAGYWNEKIRMVNRAGFPAALVLQEQAYHYDAENGVMTATEYDLLRYGKTEAC